MGSGLSEIMSTLAKGTTIEHLFEDTEITHILNERDETRTLCGRILTPGDWEGPETSNVCIVCDDIERTLQ